MPQRPINTHRCNVPSLILSEPLRAGHHLPGQPCLAHKGAHLCLEGVKVGTQLGAAGPGGAPVQGRGNLPVATQVAHRVVEVVAAGWG